MNAPPALSTVALGAGACVSLSAFATAVLAARHRGAWSSPPAHGPGPFRAASAPFALPGRVPLAIAVAVWADLTLAATGALAWPSTVGRGFVWALAKPWPWPLAYGCAGALALAAGLWRVHARAARARGFLRGDSEALDVFMIEGQYEAVYNLALVVAYGVLWSASLHHARAHPAHAPAGLPATFAPLAAHAACAIALYFTGLRAAESYRGPWPDGVRLAS